MTRQTPQPLEHTSMNATNRQARDLAHMTARGDILLNPPYQRGEVWTLDQQIALIRSWLTGVPIPALIVNNRMCWAWTSRNRDDGTGPAYAVIDGLQRMTTVIRWFNDKFAVPASWFQAEYVDVTEDTEDGTYVRFGGLTVVGQRLFANRAMLPLAEAQVATVEEEAEIYLLVNGGGTPQTDADMANAAGVAEGR